MSDRFVLILNQNPGEDVLHRNPTEVCNTDDIEGRQEIDPATAAKLLMKGEVRRCEHCYPERGRDAMETEKPQGEAGAEGSANNASVETSDPLEGVTPLPEDAELPADEPVSEDAEAEETEAEKSNLGE